MKILKSREEKKKMRIPGHRECRKVNARVQEPASSQQVFDRWQQERDEHCSNDG